MRWLYTERKTQSFDLGAPFWSGLTPSGRCQWFLWVNPPVLLGEQKKKSLWWTNDLTFGILNISPLRPVKGSGYSESCDFFLHTKSAHSCQTAQLWVDSSQTLSRILSRIGLCYRPPCASFTDTGRLRTNSHSDWQLWDFLSNCLTVPEKKTKKKFAHFSDKIPPKSLIIAVLIVFISVSASLLSLSICLSFDLFTHMLDCLLFIHLNHHFDIFPRGACCQASTADSHITKACRHVSPHIYCELRSSLEVQQVIYWWQTLFFSSQLWLPDTQSPVTPECCMRMSYCRNWQNRQRALLVLASGGDWGS